MVLGELVCYKIVYFHAIYCRMSMDTAGNKYFDTLARADALADSDDQPSIADMNCFATTG